MTAPRVWLVGESNPHGADPRHALYPEPEHSAGGRLCRKVLGLEPREYLRRFERRNLLAVGRSGAWDARAACDAAREIEEDSLTAPLVLLGRRVWEAFAYALPRQRSTTPRPEAFAFGGDGRWLYLPHPSGRCREWNVAGNFHRARLLLRVLVEGR